MVAILAPHDAEASHAINVAHDGGQPPMDTIGLDLHKRERQLCVLVPDGTAREQRILTSREREEVQQAQFGLDVVPRFTETSELP